jgi:hypothetical protein
MACHQHTQQRHQNVLRDLPTICSYGPTTTQQQAPNSTSAGFNNSQSQVVLKLKPNSHQTSLSVKSELIQ